MMLGGQRNVLLLLCKKLYFEVQGERIHDGSEIEDLFGTFQNHCSESNATLKESNNNLGPCLGKDWEMLLI